jgi:hypothetical protein
MDSTGQAASEDFERVMPSFVIALTLITLFVCSFRLCATGSRGALTRFGNPFFVRLPSFKHFRFFGDQE